MKYLLAYVDPAVPAYNRQLFSGPADADTPAAALQLLQELGPILLRPSQAPGQPDQRVDLKDWTVTVAGTTGVLANPAFPGQTITATQVG
jgi:hypothetical protein